MEKSGQADSEAKAEKWWRKDTVAVVTGANRGIGLEIVRLLAENDMTVVLTARRDQKQQLSEEARALLEEKHKNVVFHSLDVGNDDSVAVFAQWLKKEFGGLDILINNAAVLGTEFDWELLHKHNVDFYKIVYSQEDESWASGLKENYEMAKDCLDINFYGAVRTTKTLLPLMKASEGGPRIVNVSSNLGLLREKSGQPDSEAKAEKWWRKDAVAVVIGANRAIGLEIVRLFAEKGMTVVITARRDQKQQLSEEARALLEEKHKNMAFHSLDVGNVDSVALFTRWLKK